MDHNTINTKLATGEIDASCFPHLVRLKAIPFIFEADFGLKTLPREPGILLIRGARQYGKSTWLEQQLFSTIKEFGAGSAFYLNGEYIADANDLENEVEALSSSFTSKSTVRRIFIDEITAITKWEVALKKLADRGSLAKILIVTTGSKATDIRRGAEKLPGRKGKLSRTTYLFTPVSYKEFHRVCHKALGSKTLVAYLISGGSPVACSELAANGRIPEYVIELVRDWIEGEFAASGRARSSLFNILNVITRFGATPTGQAKLAREASLANNTVAAGYIELLNDLCCVVPAYPFDQHRKQLILRKACKYHFTNLLAAVAYSPECIRTPEAFLELPEKIQGIWYEWLVAQEIMRRTAILSREILEPMAFWQNDKHEIDFVVDGKKFIEVKRGKCSSLEFSWFAHQFPKQQLVVVNQKKFSTDTTRGITLEEFLLNDQNCNSSEF